MHYFLIFAFMAFSCVVRAEEMNEDCAGRFNKLKSDFRTQLEVPEELQFSKKLPPSKIFPRMRKFCESQGIRIEKHDGYAYVMPLIHSDGSLATPQELKGKHWLVVLATQMARNEDQYPVNLAFSLKDPQQAFAGGAERLIILPWGNIQTPKMPRVAVHEWLHYLRARDLIRDIRLEGSKKPFFDTIKVDISHPNGSYFSRSVLENHYNPRHLVEESYNRIREAEIGLKRAKAIADLPIDPTLIRTEILQWGERLFFTSTRDDALDFITHDRLQLEEAIHYLQKMGTKLIRRPPGGNWSEICLSYNICIKFSEPQIFAREKLSGNVSDEVRIQTITKYLNAVVDSLDEQEKKWSSMTADYLQLIKKVKANGS